nr:MAG TPA: hypothetical protein [Caudoviricetes sp.]
MRWVFKKNTENDNIIEIGYSHNNDDCDGIIIYDKKLQILNIKKYSDGCDEYDSKRAFQFIYGLLEEDNVLTFKKHIICTG